MFGRKMSEVVSCDICNFRYVPSVPEDVTSHRKRHDETVNGIRAKTAKSDRVIWKEGDYRITELCALDSKVQRYRAQRVATLGKREGGYDFPSFTVYEHFDERGTHVFLLYHKQRIIGFLVFSLRKDLQLLEWSNGTNKPKDFASNEPYWTVDFVWVLRKFRGKGFARKLIQVASDFFENPIDKIAWYPPFSKDGLELAKKLYPLRVYIGV